MRDLTMRLTFAAATLVAVAAPATDAAAQRYVYATKYCAREYDGATNCAYFTLQQCLWAVSATGGDCAVNPRYVGEPTTRYRSPPRAAYR